jgi:uncharacterized protein
MKSLFATLFLVSVVFAVEARAASFDCALAKSEIEKAICKNEELSALDEYLGRYYAAAREAVTPAEQCLVINQRGWIRTQRAACKDDACLKQAYLQRLAELDPLQPGATALRNIELPAVKALVWIVPPAADQVAAPLNKSAKPVTMRGSLLNEIEGGGDGYAVQTRDGKKTLVVPVMFLEPATGERLDALIKTGGEYELRGFEEKSADGSVHFAPSRCTLIYRVPK